MGPFLLRKINYVLEKCCIFLYTQIVAWINLQSCYNYIMWFEGTYWWKFYSASNTSLKLNSCILEAVSEKAMAPHSSTLAWKIPWTEEPGRLQFMGSWRVWHDWATSLSLFTFVHWRRKWQPTPVFLPGESQGWGSLVGCRLWGRTESDTTEAT